MPFGKFYPARIWTSNVLLSFIYYLQDDITTHSKSLENLYEVFIVKRVSYDTKHDFAVNCVLFYTMLSLDSLLQRYIEQSPSNLTQLANLLEMLNQVEIAEDHHLKKFTILRVNLIHNICISLKQLVAKNPSFSTLSILPQAIQSNIMKETRDQFSSWEKNEELNWLC